MPCHSHARKQLLVESFRQCAAGRVFGESLSLSLSLSSSVFQGKSKFLATAQLFTVKVGAPAAAPAAPVVDAGDAELQRELKARCQVVRGSALWKTEQAALSELAKNEQEAGTFRQSSASFFRAAFFLSALMENTDPRKNVIGLGKRAERSRILEEWLEALQQQPSQKERITDSISSGLLPLDPQGAS